MKASKRGLDEVQQAVDVVAGVSDPPVAKFVLRPRVGELPFYQESKIEAFLECSAAAGNWCFIANYYPCLVMQTAGQACLGEIPLNDTEDATGRAASPQKDFPNFLYPLGMESTLQGMHRFHAKRFREASFPSGRDGVRCAFRAHRPPRPRQFDAAV